MVGLLIVTHCDVGKELLKAAELILGPLEAVDHLSITSLSESEKLIEILSQKLKTLNNGKGILILTDMFGGTPSNISIPFMEPEYVEIITGVNLPMVIAIAKKRGELELKDLVQIALKEGGQGIYQVGNLLR